MLSFIISALFGAGQILLTEQLVLAVNVRDSKKIFLFFAFQIKRFEGNFHKNRKVEEFLL